MSGLDHISIFSPTSLLEPEVQFFNAALKPLGMGEQFRVAPTVVALGTKESPFFWISNLDAERNEIKESDNFQGIHIAFKAKTRKEVDEFYAAAMQAGGKDNGAPGIREMYHPNYYGCFVISPTGHNVEAVIHTPEN